MASFYDAYTKRTAENEGQGTRDLQQIGSLVQLQQAMRAQRDEQQLRGMLAQSGGNLEAVVQGALKAGRPDIAAKLAPLIEAQRKAQPQPQSIGSGGLRLPDGTIVPPAARPEQPRPQSIGAGGLRLPDGTIVPPVVKPEPQKPQPIGSGGLRLPDGTIVPPVVKPEKPEGGLTPENASKVAMAKQSVEGINTARGLLFDKDGNLNRMLVGQMNLPFSAGMPANSQARIARSAMRNAIEAKLRLETGAAATESEVERTLARFMPTVADTKESAKFKMDELEKFFKSSLSMTKGVSAPSQDKSDPLGIRGR